MLHLTDAAPRIPGLRPDEDAPSGAIHLVVFDTREHRRRFADHVIAAAATTALRAAERDSGARLLAWVLLPDRWHGLVELGPHASLPRFVARIQVAMAHALGDDDPESSWSTTYQDRALRTDGMILECARHLVMSPVRAGLVERPLDYPFWDAIWFDPPRRNPIEEPIGRDVPELLWEPL